MYLDKIKTYFKKLNYKSFVFIYMLLFTIMPVIPRWTSMYLTTYFYMLIVVSAVLFTLVMCRIKSIKDYIFLLLPFVLYELMVMISDQNDDVILSGYQVLLFMLPVCVGFYLASRSVYTNPYTAVLVIGYVVTAVTTIIGCALNPNAARVLATTATSQDATAIQFDLMNIGGYYFIYSMVLLYPFVILAFKMRKLNIVPTVILTLLTYTAVIYAEYTYALMLLMLSTLLFFVKRDISLKKFVLLILVFAAAVFIFRATVAALFTSFGNFIGNNTMTDKVNALFLGKDAVENFDDDRGALYQLSLDMFLKSPLFGTLLNGRKVTGGHSFIIDNLARYGLIGGLLMVFMYRRIYLTFYKPLSGREGFCFVVWIFIQPILLSLLNTGMWLDNLCMFSVLLLYSIYGVEVYNENTLDRKYGVRPLKLSALRGSE